MYSQSEKPSNKNKPAASKRGGFSIMKPMVASPLQRKDDQFENIAQLQAIGINKGHVIQRLGIPGTHAQIATADYVDPTNTIPGGGNVAPSITPVTSNTVITEPTGSQTVAEGAKMTAFPLSSRTSAGGSPTNANVRLVSQKATAFFGKMYYAGHLLNNHIGGDGTINQNITAFRSKSNAQHHAGIEKDLKKDVANGFIAHYVVNCTDRAGVKGSPTHYIKGLANTLEASYSLLNSGGNPAAPGDYTTLRTLRLQLDPGGLAQVATKNGDAMGDSEVVIQNTTTLFTNAGSTAELTTLLNGAAGMNAETAIAHVLAGAAAITDAADRAALTNNFAEIVRVLD
jgi:hypothetical protein